MTNQEIPQLVKSISGEVTTLEQKRELSKFRRMIRRTDCIVQPTFVTLSNELEIPTEYVFATVSLDVKGEQDYEVEEHLTMGAEHRLYKMKSEHARSFAERLVSNLRVACEAGAHYVCANELGYVCCKDEAENLSLRQYLSKEISSLANQYGAYIVPGTYHCSDTLLNLAPVYYPGANPDHPNVLHAKKTSAVALDEKVRVPYNRDVRFYKTQYGSIGIMICLDSYDPSLVVGLVHSDSEKRGFGPRGVDIIFVPSMNRDNPRAADACEDLSFFLSNIVVLSNAMRYGEYRSKAFMCGEPITGTAIGNGEVLVYRIAAAEYKAKKQQLDSCRTSIFRTIFAISNVELSPL